MNRTHIAFVAAFAFLTMPALLQACSSASCINRGNEMRNQFKVKVTFDGKPLAGAQVEVTNGTAGDDYDKVIFTGTTASDGSVRVPQLRPGDYNLSADYLGISAGYDCFHVLIHSGWKAKGHVTYEWGDEAAGVTGQIQGNLTDGERDPNLPLAVRNTQLKAVPIVGATLSLRGPATKEPYVTTTGDDGHFAFTGIPNGTYVLHLDAGKSVSRNSYQQNDQLIRVSSGAKPDDLEWELGAAICGSATFYFGPRRGQ